VIDLFTKGWLPYTLRWRFKSRNPTRLTDSSRGLTVISSAPDLDFTQVRRLPSTSPMTGGSRVNKRLLQKSDAVFRPIFAANHPLGDGGGEESLEPRAAPRRPEVRTSGRRSLHRRVPLSNAG